MALTKIPSSLLDTSSGLDLSGNITLGDSEQIQLGTDNDLQIYHDGSNSYISENGTGNLILKGGGQIVLRTPADENMIAATGNGAVNLFYDGSPKIATSSAGATVTGTLTVTGDLDITGNINSYNVTDLDVTDQTITLGAGQTAANSGGSGIIIDGSNASILWDETNTEFDINNNINVTGIITASGEITANGGIALGDNDKATFGASDTFEIYTDGTDSFIKETAAGSLKLLGTNIDLVNAAGTELGLRFVTNDAVTVYYDGSPKLATTSTGIDVTGTATMDGLTVDGNAQINGDITITDTSADPFLKLATSEREYVVRIDNDDSDKFQIRDVTGAATRVTLDTSGNVGISDINPSFKLDVNNTSSRVRFKATTGDSNLELSSIAGRDYLVQSLSSGSFRIYDEDASSARLTIDTSGSVEIGSLDILNTSGGQAPLNYLNIEGATANNSNYPGIGFTGGTLANVYPYISLTNGGLALTLVAGRHTTNYNNAANIVLQGSTGDIIFSTNSGSAAGVEKMRLQSNGYLNVKDGILFGSDSAAANALDDYEEGTYSPTLANESNITSLSLSEAGRYVKIGNLVHFECQVEGNFTSASSEARFSFTLPFNTATSTPRAVGMFAFIKSGAFSNDRFSNGQIYQGTSANSFYYVYIGSTQIPNNGDFTGRLTFTYQAA